jgi:hypothetical protein
VIAPRVRRWSTSAARQIRETDQTVGWPLVAVTFRAGAPFPLHLLAAPIVLQAVVMVVYFAIYVPAGGGDRQTGQPQLQRGRPC